MTIQMLNLLTHRFAPAPAEGYIKKIKTTLDLDTFQTSQVCNEILEFLQSVGEVIQEVEQGQNPSSDKEVSPIIQALCSVLQQLERWTDEFPPIKQQMRFGNLAFRDWITKVETNSGRVFREALRNAVQQDLERLFPVVEKVDKEEKTGDKEGLGILEESEPRPSPEEQLDSLADELNDLYLVNAFGNRIRLDFGTGHELNFIALVLCLCKFKLLDIHQDGCAIVKALFTRYLVVTRKLQHLYCLEPAGSRGAWGLDDYHFVPFLWGAYELKNQTNIQPKDAIDPLIAQKFQDKYLYCNAIHQIYLFKTHAPFAETSPMLYDISAVPFWSKVASGMVKMYRGEVLSKFPVMQHFPFGTILTLISFSS
eukprot:Protomagalhaensia_wolfi_Nauph_80__4595@NODE_473_length_2463_cov_289_775578_g312_i1_p1_GENE_NODE_473_length_2463_cov_289_775578_g312_i1NODE_473_length_2463_cov_289_775578_g312_i1_p1_ORF_typecomplete_len367_score63_06PTPA/PF03095_15/1_5e103DUF885/PF05960_11/0_1DNA_pol_phi/PF04931_13/0_18_NODE_473_length_2463_cov_289_775578_g312_i111112211